MRIRKLGNKPGNSWSIGMVHRVEMRRQQGESRASREEIDCTLAAWWLTGASPLCPRLHAGSRGFPLSRDSEARGTKICECHLSIQKLGTEEGRGFAPGGTVCYQPCWGRAQSPCHFVVFPAPTFQNRHMWELSEDSRPRAALLRAQGLPVPQATSALGWVMDFNFLLQ